METISETGPGPTATPADVFKHLTAWARESIDSRDTRRNLDVIIDIHWFFLHSKHHKQKYHRPRHIGKWKYFAGSHDEMYACIRKVLPHVAEGTLPVAKFTNTANVFTGEKEIVVYCFPFGPSPQEAEVLLKGLLGDKVVWGSKKFVHP